MTRIMAVVLLAAFVAIQDPSPVPTFAARVDEKDPQGSLRAIALLARQPAALRGEIEAVAAKWPEFYKDAWRADVKSRDSLKSLLRPTVTVSLRGTDTPLAGLLSELARRTGLEVDPGSDSQGIGKTRVTIESIDATPMEALADLCRESSMTPTDRMGSSAIVLQQLPKREVAPLAAGHFGLFFQHMGIRERVDFSAPTERVARLNFLVMWDKEIDVATIRPQVRLVEAVADTGEKLKLSDRKPASSLREWEEYHNHVSRNRNRALEISVVIPSPKIAKIARLRFVVTALVPRRVREYIIENPGDPEKCRAQDEEFIVTVTAMEGLPTGRSAGIHIRPLKMKPEELHELPLTFKLSYARAGEGQTSFKPKLASGGVDYVVNWYPVNYNDRNHTSYGTEVQSAKVVIPLDLEERSFHVDLKDIPLR